MGIENRQQIRILLIISAAAALSKKNVGQHDCMYSSISVCPSQCCCRHDTNKSEFKADCSWKNLSKIPNNFSNDTTKIFLEGNLIEEIPPMHFLHLNYLKVLRLEENEIKLIQRNALSNPSLVRLYLGRNYLSYLTEGAFSGLPNLEELGLSHNPIRSVEWRTFTNLPKLQDLVLCCVRNLTRFPDLTGTNNLKKIIIDRCLIASVPSNLCRNNMDLQKLDLHSNAISIIPKLSSCSKLISIHFGNNKIYSLEGRLFRGLSLALDLCLKSNRISRIPADAFIGLSGLNYLDMKNNGIEYIHRDTFKPLKQLQALYLEDNKLRYLPSDGLLNLLILVTSSNEHLEEIPAPKDLPNIEMIVAAYPYHCCEYMRTVRGTVAPSYQSSYFTYPSPSLGLSENFSSSSSIFINDRHRENTSLMPSSMSSDYISSSFIFDEYTPSDFMSSSYSIIPSGGIPWEGVSCIPQPGPFMPCSDLFGSWFLRVGVWLVFLLSLIGNGIVILVIIFSHTKVDVSRFLICNLACADFAMGIYLGFLAGVDAATLGVFRKYGVHWQLSAGCGAASFLAVFSSELSIYTLSVITLERFYAIKHALHLEKRLKLQQALVIMFFGWIFAITVALMPLSGVNNYYRYPVCLPFDISTRGAFVYASGILILNGASFIAIMGCYISIYCAIQGSHAWNCNDSRVARRMSLLVFTDFVCWAPIAFFGLTSTFNLRLISLHGAKILTVFVLPVNSCANPFLYTIFTKQFKKDCFRILHCFRSRRIPVRQAGSPVITPSEASSSLRSSLSHLVLPSCCRTSSTASQDHLINLNSRHSSSHPKYNYYQSEICTNCQRSRFQSRLLQNMGDEEDFDIDRTSHRKCSCLVLIWKRQKFSKSHEDVSLQHIQIPEKRRHSITDDVLFHGRERPTIFITDDKYTRKNPVLQEPSTSKTNPHQYELLDGQEPVSATNSSKCMSISISIGMNKEYEHKNKVLKSVSTPANRPSDLRMNCSPIQITRVDDGLPTPLSSPNMNTSDCSSLATTTSDCWSLGLSPTYSPGICPQILITQAESSSSSMFDSTLTYKDIDKSGETCV